MQIFVGVDIGQAFVRVCEPETCFFASVVFEDLVQCLWPLSAIIGHLCNMIAVRWSKQSCTNLERELVKHDQCQEITVTTAIVAPRVATPIEEPLRIDCPVPVVSVPRHEEVRRKISRAWNRLYVELGIFFALGAKDLVDEKEKSVGNHEGARSKLRGHPALFVYVTLMMLSLNLISDCAWVSHLTSAFSCDQAA